MAAVYSICHLKLTALMERPDLSLRTSLDAALQKVYGLDRFANCCLGLEATSQAHNLAKADSCRHTSTLDAASTTFAQGCSGQDARVVATLQPVLRLHVKFNLPKNKAVYRPMYPPSLASTWSPCYPPCRRNIKTDKKPQARNRGKYIPYIPKQGAQVRPESLSRSRRNTAEVSERLLVGGRLYAATKFAELLLHAV